MPPNTSASGGYLLPDAQPEPLYGKALNDFFQGLVKGITGMAGDLVRPSPQGEPPNIPEAATAWAAIQTTVVPSDTFPAVIHLPNANGGAGVDQLQRHEQINILASFYDLGTNGEADRLCSLLRDGLSIAQNREPLLAQHMGLNSVKDKTVVPSLLKMRWLYRVDLPFIVSRAVTRNYRVENVQSANGQIVTSAGFVLNIDVEQADQE